MKRSQAWLHKGQAQADRMRVEAGGYRLGPEVLEFSRAFVRGTDLHTEFHRLLAGHEAVRDETVIGSVRRGIDVVDIARRPGSQRIGIRHELGSRLPAHCTASGLAILGLLSVEEAQRLYKPLRSEGLQALTPRSMVAVTQVLRSIEEVRSAGHAVDDEETANGMLWIRAAIDDASQQGVGAVAVSVVKGTRSKTSLAGLRRAIRLVAHEISAALGAPST